MAIGRPDDIGQQFPSDATVLGLPDVHEGRSIIDYGTRPDFNEALTLTSLSQIEGTVNPVRQFAVFAATDEILIAREITLDENGEEQESILLFFIAKPITLRKSSYDTDGDEDADGFVVTSVTAGRRSFVRTRDGNTFTHFEDITPAYNVEDRVFAIASEGTGLPGVILLDMNGDVRHWESDEPLYKDFVITSFNRDTFECQEWNQLTKLKVVDAEGADLPPVQVAKPIALRGSNWAADILGVGGPFENPDGVEYTTQNGTNETDPYIEREARNDSGTDIVEDQEILPPWFPWDVNNVHRAVLRAVRVDVGTGAIFDNTESLWQDTNDGGHQFGVKFV